MIDNAKINNKLLQYIYTRIILSYVIYCRDKYKLVGIKINIHVNLNAYVNIQK